MSATQLSTNLSKSFYQYLRAAPLCEIKASKFGRGLFANKDIKFGEIIVDEAPFASVNSESAHLENVLQTEKFQGSELAEVRIYGHILHRAFQRGVTNPNMLEDFRELAMVKRKNKGLNDSQKRIYRHLNECFL
eukprot:UN01625